MNKIFIYYSLTGNGDMVADFLHHKYEVLKLETTETLPRFKPFQLLTGGFKAALGFKDPLTNLDINLEDYPEIIIGSPIWNDRLCCPINTLLEKLLAYDVKLTFVLYSGSGKAKKAVEYIRKNYDAKIIILKEPKRNPLELNKLKELFKGE